MKTQTKISLAIIASMITAAALLFFGVAKHRAGNGKDEVRDLSAKIQRLEQKTAALQSELKDLQNRPPSLLAVPGQDSVTPSVNSSFLQRQAPPGWTPFEFNGVTYYFTPLGNAPQLSMGEPK